MRELVKLGLYLDWLDYNASICRRQPEFEETRGKRARVRYVKLDNVGGGGNVRPWALDFGGSLKRRAWDQPTDSGNRASI